MPTNFTTGPSSGVFTRAEVNRISSLLGQLAQVDPAIVTGTGVSTVSPTASGTSVDVQLLLNAIPIAEDGHVITSEYHNSLRTAILLLAEQLGVGPISREVLATYPPSFDRNEEGPNWLQANGIATKDATTGDANGFFALQFPNEARIQSMTVTGRRVGNIDGPFVVRLLRVTIADGENVPLINMSLKNAPDPFKVTQTIQVAGAGPAALEEYKLVNNNLYTYLVTARVLRAADLVQINGIQISYTLA